MKRCLLLIGCVVFTASTVVFAWGLIPSHPVKRANFERIQDGMTLEDVIAILGQPDDCAVMDESAVETKRWSGGPNLIDINLVYDENKLVVRGKIGVFPTFWERIEDWWNGRDQFGGKRLKSAE
jgi:hypothetical protein